MLLKIQSIILFRITHILWNGGNCTVDRQKISSTCQNVILIGAVWMIFYDFSENYGNKVYEKKKKKDEM